ncbi:hypothetical protein [Actinomadura oligospora]|uniref:hypothetical protein n=1 Tax=Actinomadura oligospora TaxID=111804 RepID=UPI0004B161E6|nr:hypothetical protein [Actinomadura oligospora]
MTQTIAIRLAISGLLLISATACNDDGKNTASAPASTPATSTQPPGSTPPASNTPPTPQPTRTKPKITNSKQIVMIDPDGKRYSFTTMVQMAAGMRATMGDKAPSGFCEKSYRDGVKGGGTFPAGRDVFLAACREGLRKSEDYMRQN